MKKYAYGMSYLLVTVALFVSGALFIPSATHASTYAIPYEVNDNQTLLPGMIVVVDSNMHVRSARQDEASTVLGAVASLPANSLPSNQVGVTSSGLASVLVSDLSGEIKKGDRIAISPVEGVGMKAVTSGWVVGVAQEAFSDSTTGLVRQKVRSSGGEVEASIRAMPVLLSVTHYDPEGGIVIGTAQGIVDLIAGHSVSIEKTVTALIIFGVALIVMIAMIYSTVRSSIISIGRNPMASRLITRALTKTMLYMMLVVAIAMATIYVIVVS